MELVPLHESLIPALHRFHQRLADNGGPSYRFGTAVVDSRDGTEDTIRSRTKTLVVVDDNEIRGGVIVQHHRFHTAIGEKTVVNIQLPLSEGTIDKRFAHVGLWLMRTLLVRHPLAYAVGMGGLQQPLPKLLAAMRWTLALVPFLFRVNNVQQFLTSVPLLRRNRAIRAASLVAAYSGAGWLSLRAIHGLTTLRHRPRNMQRTHTVKILEWGDWASELWSRGRSMCTLTIERDAAELNVLYPPQESSNFCFRVLQGEQTVGWFVLVRTTMTNNEYFGNMVVGTVLDCACEPGYERHVARAAQDQLALLNADVSLTNQMHSRWQDAFRSAGYLTRPSNFVFAASPALMACGGAIPTHDILASTHVTRGDGDGRIHLV